MITVRVKVRAVESDARNITTPIIAALNRQFGFSKRNGLVFWLDRFSRVMKIHVSVPWSIYDVCALVEIMDRALMETVKFIKHGKSGEFYFLFSVTEKVRENIYQWQDYYGIERGTGFINYEPQKLKLQ